MGVLMYYGENIKEVGLKAWKIITVSAQTENTNCLPIFFFSR